MAATEAFVTPKLIEWARLRHHIGTDSAAQKLNIKEDTLKAWESGVARPTLRQAQVLANKLNVPLGYLFLDSPPKEELPLPDLRMVAGQPPQQPSPDFIDLLYDVLRKQQWYHEYLESQRALPKEFVGRFQSNHVRPDIIAADIRETLHVDSAMREMASTWEGFLREFISRAEGVGVLVMRSGTVKNSTRRKLSVWEFRGFAISDTLAPLVFINGNDARAAQIFTLAHELAHLWMGASGISNPDYRKKSSEQNNNIERLCDSVAAEVVTPRVEFLLRWSDASETMFNLQTLATRFRVSRWVVLRQAYDLGKLNTDEYDEYYDRLRQEQRQPSAGGGGDFYPAFVLRNSSVLTSTLIASVAEGRVLHRDAARLLGINVSTLDGVARHLLGVQANRG